jgi:hypothetical protein
VELSPSVVHIFKNKYFVRNLVFKSMSINSWYLKLIVRFKFNVVYKMDNMSILGSRKIQKTKTHWFQPFLIVGFGSNNFNLEKTCQFEVQNKANS